MLDTSSYRVKPGHKFSLANIPTREDGGLQKADALTEFIALRKRLIHLEELFYANARKSLLVVIQGMDTSGKDTTIRAVFSGFGPSGVRVTDFKAPTQLELEHDFLWRIHTETPRLGRMAVFNRSHYEDVLIVRVNELVPKEQWKARYEHINAFERVLADEGTIILKFYLHISSDYQKKRLQRRLDNPKKHWKFNPGDLKVRQQWDEYMQAYEDAITRCSTDCAPWYIIPAERRWFRNLLVTSVLVETLESLDMHFPKANFNPADIKIP